MAQVADMSLLCEYFHRCGALPSQEDLPVVFVKVKVYHVVRVREPDQKYEADFTLMLDWIDPSVAEKVRGMNREQAHSYDLSGHFMPEVLVDNAVNEDVQPVGGPQLPRLEFADESWRDGHVKLTQRFRIELNQQFHVQEFPFDKQTLQLVFKSKSVRILGRTFQVELRDGPTSPREDFEHSIDKRWRVEDWVTLGIHGAPTKAHHERKSKTRDDMYIVGIEIMREPSTGFWMFLFPLITTGLLSLTAYGAPPSDVGDRTGVVVTLVLTVTAFKFVLSNSIPPVAYLTDVDKLIVSTTCLLILQAFMFVVAAVVERNDPSTYTYFEISSGRLVDLTLGGIIGVLSLWVQFNAWRSYQTALRAKEEAMKLLTPSEGNPVLVRSNSMEKTADVTATTLPQPSTPAGCSRASPRAQAPKDSPPPVRRSQLEERKTEERLMPTTPHTRASEPSAQPDVFPDNVSDASTEAESEFSVAVVDELILVHQPFSNGGSHSPREHSARP